MMQLETVARTCSCVAAAGRLTLRPRGSRAPERATVRVGRVRATPLFLRTHEQGDEKTRMQAQHGSFCRARAPDSERSVELLRMDGRVYECCSEFDSFVSMRLKVPSPAALPSRWPAALQMLELDWCLDLTDRQQLPPFPPGLRSLAVRHCKLSSVPDVRACAELEELDLQDNHIGPELDDVALPPNLRRLNVSYNKVRIVPWSRLPPALVVLDASFNFLRAPPPPPSARNATLAHVNCDNNDFPTPPRRVKFEDEVSGRDVPIPTFESPPFRTAVPPIQAFQRPTRRPPVQVPGTNISIHFDEMTVYENRENVHASSVSAATEASLKALNEAFARLRSPPSPGPAVRAAWLDELCEALDAVDADARGRADTTTGDGLLSRLLRLMRWTAWTAWTACTASHATSERTKASIMVREWSCDRCVHSRYAMTLGELLRKVWGVAREHASRDDIVRVLHADILDGNGKCFTGRFVRVLNVLSCFVDGMAIGISPMEQLQARLGAIWKADVQALVEKQGENKAVSAEHRTRVLAAVDAALADNGQISAADAAVWKEPFVDALGCIESENLTDETARDELGCETESSIEM